MAVLLKEIETFQAKMFVAEPDRNIATTSENEDIKFAYNMLMLESNYGLYNFISND